MEQHGAGRGRAAPIVLPGAAGDLLAPSASKVERVEVGVGQIAQSLAGGEQDPRQDLAGHRPGGLLAVVTGSRRDDELVEVLTDRGADNIAPDRGELAMDQILP